MYEWKKMHVICNKKVKVTHSVVDVEVVGVRD